MTHNEDSAATVSSRVDIEYPDFTKLSSPSQSKTILELAIGFLSRPGLEGERIAILTLS